MRGNETLNQIIEVLRELGGYFTFTDSAGEEYVVMRKQDAGQLRSSARQPEVQLVLPPSPTLPSNTADLLLDRINRDIALYQEAQEQFDDLAIPEEESNDETREPLTQDAAPTPPPRRVRFEPLRGDLPPELQE